MAWQRILMIDDDAVFRRMVSEYFTREGAELTDTSRADVFAFSEAARSQVILLGRSIAEEGGAALIKKLRGAGNTPLILISSVRDANVAGLSQLVSYEMFRPFDILELYRRVGMLLPEECGAADEAAEYQGLRVSLKNGSAEADGITVSLCAKEAELLHLLITNPDRALSRKEIASRVWGRLMAEDGTISVHINRIRKKIGSYGSNIVAVRGLGYKFRTKN